MAMCDWGFPLDKIDLRMIVAAYRTKQKRVVLQFKNNIPGDDWASNFMKRWKLTQRVATNIRRKRGKLARTELETYFNNIKKEAEGVPATNIWNYDATNLWDDPGGKKAVMKRETKYPERVMDSKSCYSILFCGNAKGYMIPTYTVYKSVHLYDTWIRGGPKDARYNRTRSGWFVEVSFEDCFSPFFPN